MAITVVQTASGSGGSVFPKSFASPVTAGNTVVIVVNMIQSGNPVVAAPTLGGNAVPGTFAVWNDSGNTNAIVQPSPACASTVWVLPNCPAANGIDFGTKNISNNVGTVLYEIAGLGSPVPVIDKSSEQSFGASANPTSGASGNTTVAPAFVLGVCASYSGPTVGATGFTCVGPTNNGWAGYQIATAAGSSYTWLQTAASGGYTAGVVALVAGSVAAPTSNNFFLMQ